MITELAVLLAFPAVVLSAFLLCKYAIRQMDQGKKGW